jgi:ABC-type uncharacterized transport system permease subunit
LAAIGITSFTDVAGRWPFTSLSAIIFELAFLDSPIKSIAPESKTPHYSFVFPVFFALAHLALAAAEIAALPAALIFLLGF